MRACEKIQGMSMGGILLSLQRVWLKRMRRPMHSSDSVFAFRLEPKILAIRVLTRTPVYDFSLEGSLGRMARKAPLDAYPWTTLTFLSHLLGPIVAKFDMRLIAAGDLLPGTA